MDPDEVTPQVRELDEMELSCEPRAVGPQSDCYF